MPESGRRVVLLARPGPARECLRAALSEVGAGLALEADPTQVSVDELAAARPEVVIVALDSVSEQALDRLEGVLLDPAIDVMFEEADIAANRSGWDAARWVRHLSAKLNRHGDVLPPGATAQPDAGEAATRTGTPVDHGPAHAAAGDGEPADAPADAAAWAPADMPSLSPVEPEPVPAHPLSDEFTSGVEPGSYGAFDPVAAEMTDIEQTADQVITFDLRLDDGFSIDDTSAATELPSLDLVFDSEIPLPVEAAPALEAGRPFDELSLDDLRGDTASPPALVASGLELDTLAPEASGSMQPSAPQSFDLDIDLPTPVVTESEPPATPAEPYPNPDPVEPPPASQPAPAPAFAGASAGHVLELVTDDRPILPAAGGQNRTDMEALERRIASLELVDDRPAASAATATGGAVLLVAGIGGPDAVRQLLGALPQEFPRPVVVQQRLDGGRYDRLVTQMQRASRLPVALAETGSALSPGVVYVLPAGMGVASGADGLRFDDSGNALDALPPADSAVVLLSGGDVALADTLAEPAWADAFVAGQAAEGCYDPAASTALAATGRPTAQPTDLAQRLTERWSAG